MSKKWIIALIIVFIPYSVFGAVLFSETWDSAGWLTNWYDNRGAGGTRQTSGCYAGAGCYECAFASSGQYCTGGAPQRRAITATDELYIKYYIKLSSNWQGSGKAYHPHMIFALSDADDDYSGFYWTYNTLYVELGGAKSRIGIQDSKYISSSPSPPWANTCPATETRAVGGCNGKCDSGTWDYTDCYYDGEDWLNMKMTGSSASAMSLNEWHKVEAYFKMNTIVGGVSQSNGIMELIVDDTVTVNITDMQYRTNSHGTIKWDQIAISPYMGDGSPAAQTLWIDEMEVHNSMPTVATPSLFGVVLSGGTVK